MKCAWAKVQKIIDSLSEDYTVVVLADHGGHDRIHGTTEDSDMTIPVFIKGKDFEGAKSIDGVNIIDIAPTICKVLGVKADKEWEGKSLL
jgi:arylsulfatase A-like enzyme